MNPREEFVLVAQRAWTRGLIAGTGGNMSLRDGDAILIKPSGMANVACRQEDLLRLDMEGRVLSGLGIPSKDTNFHLAIYAERPEVGGVLHAHVPWSTALTLSGFLELPMVTVHAPEKLGSVPVLPEAPSASTRLRDLIAAAFRDPSRRAVLLERHGVVTAAPTLSAAGELAELVEETAQIAMLARLAAAQPQTRPSKEYR